MTEPSKFIYVFSADDKERLIKAGFKLLKTNHKKPIYIFENACNDPQFEFDLSSFKYILSDTLTF